MDEAGGPPPRILHAFSRLCSLARDSEGHQQRRPAHRQPV